MDCIGNSICSVFKHCNRFISKFPVLFLAIRVSFGVFMTVTVLLPFLIVKFGIKRLFLTRNPVRTGLDFDLSSKGFHELEVITDDGVNLHLVRRGNPDKPVVLFLHGFPDSWLTWEKQMTFLSPDSNSRVCSVALSLRGYGKSGKPEGKENYTILKLTHDIKKVVEFLKKEEVVLVGHDWGGVIAWAFTALHPELVSRLIILNAPQPHKFSQLLIENLRQFMSSWYIYLFQIPYLPEYIIQMGDFAFLELTFRDVIKSGRMSVGDLYNTKFFCSQKGQLTAMLNYYRHARHGNREVPKISSPTLVIWGERDLALPPVNLVGLDEYVDDLTVIKLPGASHFVHLEDPDAVNKEILSFISS